jgi:anthraniloyl-CoA monooxygenase
MSESNGLVRPLRIVCVGGGPAGLYFALLMKKQNPQHQVTVFERNRPDDTFGWGVVFSDQTLGNLQAADPQTAGQISDAFNHWDDIEVHISGNTVRSGGHGFCGIGRLRLLDILQTRCRELGVDLRFSSEVVEERELPEADLIVAADGANSRIRNRYAAEFQPDIDVRKCRFVWFGTHKLFEAFTFAFERTQWGWFQAHAYRFDDSTSTFIVEAPEEVWRAAGLEDMEKEESIAFCERLFARYLDGQPLMSNAHHLRGSAQWIRFPRVVCKNWVHHNGRATVVLMGDAAHTAHFSIGSGTKLALEDAIELSRLCAGAAAQDLPRVLQQYQDVRNVEVAKLQNAARNSTDWFENVSRYATLDPEQFAYSLLTRSQRISHENLRLRDRAYVARVESHIARRSGMVGPDKGAKRSIPPMFTSFRLRELTLSNRIVVSPMAQYSCESGVPDDYYLVHIGSRAQGGAGLVFTEMTCISPDARITPGCAGLYDEVQLAAWKRIVEYVHRHTPARIAMQLGHAGPKGSTQLGWQAIDEPLPAGNWPLIAASDIAYGPENQVPRSMTRTDMDAVKVDFINAARRAEQCGFDWLELHCAHGYLLSSFICPLTNRRTDEYGGTLENRCRYPLEVFRALREVWPSHKPMSVRISAHDWAPGGNTADDAVRIATWFKEAGADLIDVSSGQTTRQAQPIYGRMYQTPFADRIRNEAGIATMAVGAIFEPDHVNSIIAAGRADLCAIARPHLADPYWTLHAAAQQNYRGIDWPQQYLTGRDQLYRNLAKAAQTPMELPHVNG